MPKISSVSLTTTPVEYEPPLKYVGGAFIHHDSQTSTYEYFIKYDGETSFSPLLDESFSPISTTSKFQTILLRPDKVYANIRIDYFDGSENVSFFTDRFDFSSDEGFVQINGRILDIQGTPLECVEIHVNLKPDLLDFIIGDSIIDNVDNHVYSDVNGYWSVMLAPNKATDQFKKIKDNKTFYEFSIFGKTILREIDFDNGLVQQFSSLMMPEEHRIKKDVYSDLRT